MKAFVKIELCLVVVCGAANLAAATERYVSLAGSNDAAGGYTNWAGAATQIQYAISACVSGDVVWVSNGTYEAGATVISGVTNRVALTNAITLRSLNNDPTNTIIKGGLDIRPVYMANNATLIGFTVTNGIAAVPAGTFYGGGIRCESTNVVISNCVITGNTGGFFAGGVYKGNLYNCYVIANKAQYGGGAQGGNLTACHIAGNSASQYGGGVHQSCVYNSTLISNTASMGGGGGYGSAGNIMSNCIISANSATTNGGGGTYLAYTLYDCTLIANSAIGANAGGAQQGTLYNCSLISNTAALNGGGAHNANLYNCELRGNSAGIYGGGAKGGTLVNCLVTGNNAGEGSAAYQSLLTNCLVIGNMGVTTFSGNWNLSMLYNCTLSGNSGRSQASTFWNCISWSNNVADSGISNYYSCGAGAIYASGGLAGCVTNDPVFIANGTGGYGANLVPGNYRLARGSPCINAGTNQPWMANAQDLDGVSRIDRFSRRVDMGCYEYISRGTMFGVR